jgi:dTDP-4-amino-4,6-dideoxygalactose transaminase
MTEIQAAIGRLQLRKLPEWTARRRANAACLIEGLGAVRALRIPVPPAHIRHAYYKFYAFLEPSALREGWNRERIVSEINAQAVPCFSGSCSEIYLEKAFAGHRSRPAERLSVASELGETSLMFLVHPTLTQGHIERTIEVATKVCAQALR